MRTINGFYLRSLDKIQGVHKIFDTHSQMVIIRRKIIEIKIHKTIIKHIEEMAACDKSIFLKFKNRAVVIYDNDWIAGVEY